MKRVLLVFLLLFAISKNNFSQQDTIPYEDIGLMFSELNDSLFHGHLLNRSFNQDSIMLEQISGDYSSYFDPLTFLRFLTVIKTSNVNGEVAQETANVAQEIIDFYVEKIYDDSKTNDEIPFGIAIHDMHWIDSSAVQNGLVSIQNSKVTPNVEESTLYRNKKIIAASPIDFRNLVTSRQELVYDDRFVFLGDNVTLKNVSVNLGNGYRKMKNGDAIEYPSVQDSLLGSTIINYKIDSVDFTDTVFFMIYNSKNESSEGLAKSDPDESEYLVYDSDSEYKIFGLYGTEYKMNMMLRCNADDDPGPVYVHNMLLPRIKRPVILITPYFPAIQGEDGVNTVTLFNQFNTWGVFNELSNLGYDVIVVENQTAFMPVKTCGLDFASVIWMINRWKKKSFPDEDWENVVIGYSMGGQVAKYALKYMEKQHMENDSSHHHTRLYISFDSPHHGAKIPMGCQSVFYSYHHTGSILASVVYLSLVDGGSVSMVEPHIKPNISNFSVGSIVQEIHNSDGRTQIRENLLEDLYINLQHSKSYVNDERKPFPAFTRNVAVSMGSYKDDYTDEYGLTYGQLLYEHTSLLKNARLYASSYGNARPSFTRFDLFSFATGISVIHKKYQTFGIPEWDLANGGFKTIFYNNVESSGVPTGAIQVLGMAHGGAPQNNAFSQLHYERETSFMPIVSGLAINENLWTGNDIFYNPQDEGLMNIGENTSGNLIESDFFGYPNLGHTDHFEITPFEAIYADEITYEHIKPIQTIGELNSDNPANINYAKYLDSMKNFIVREVQDDIVCLQNFHLGANQETQNSNEKYKARYRAKKEIRIGREVTPKTDIGDYVVTEDGHLTVNAGEKIVKGPGFHAEYGSFFHSYIGYKHCDDPSVYDPSKMAQNDNNENQINSYNNDFKENTNSVETEELSSLKVYPNPNKGSFTIVLPMTIGSGMIVVSDLSGRQVWSEKVNDKRQINVAVNLPSGIYILKFSEGEKEFFEKIIIQ